MPTLGIELTMFYSEGYCFHAINCLSYRKNADIGTGTNVVCIRRLLLARVQPVWILKGI